MCPKQKLISRSRFSRTMWWVSRTQQNGVSSSELNESVRATVKTVAVTQHPAHRTGHNKNVILKNRRIMVNDLDYDVGLSHGTSGVRVPPDVCSGKCQHYWKTTKCAGRLMHSIPATECCWQPQISRLHCHWRWDMGPSPYPTYVTCSHRMEKILGPHDWRHSRPWSLLAERGHCILGPWRCVTPAFQFQLCYWNMKAYWQYTEIFKFQLVVHQQKSLRTSALRCSTVLGAIYIP